MGKKRSKFLAVSAATLVASAGVLGSSMPAFAGQTSQPVTITWYYPQTNQATAPNLQQVENAINKISVAKIGVKVNLQPIASGDYQQKLSVMLQTGQADGIVWTSNWLLPYTTEVYAKAFMPLNTLLNQSGQALKKQIGTKFLNGAAVNGQIYGIPSIQIEVSYAQLNGQIKPSVAKTIPYPLDLQENKVMGYYTSPNVQNYAQLEKFLKAVHQSHPELDPMVLSNGNSFDSTVYGYWAVMGGENNNDLPFYIQAQKTYGSQPPKISLALNAQEQFITMMHRWYTEGLVNQNAGTMTSTESQAEIGTGKSVIYGSNPVPIWNPGDSNVLPGYDNLIVPLKQGPLSGKYLFYGDQSTINAISATCSHPKQALELLQLVNTDPQVYNLLSYGIQGVDYKKTGANTISFTKAGQDYFMNDNWVFGDVFNGYVTYTAPGFSWKTGLDMNSEAVSSPAVGFNFNPQPVQTQIAMMSQVAKQYDQPLFNGVYPVSKFNDYEKAMNAAGQMQVLAEMQKQFDAWWKQTH